MVLQAWYPFNNSILPLWVLLEISSFECNRWHSLTIFSLSHFSPCPPFYINFAHFRTLWLILSYATGSNEHLLSHHTQFRLLLALSDSDLYNPIGSYSLNCSQSKWNEVRRLEELSRFFPSVGAHDFISSKCFASMLSPKSHTVPSLLDSMPLTGS